MFGHYTTSQAKVLKVMPCMPYCWAPN